MDINERYKYKEDERITNFCLLFRSTTATTELNWIDFVLFYFIFCWQYWRRISIVMGQVKWCGDYYFSFYMIYSLHTERERICYTKGNKSREANKAGGSNEPHVSFQQSSQLFSLFIQNFLLLAEWNKSWYIYICIGTWLYIIE